MTMSAEDTYWMDGREKLSPVTSLSREELLEEANVHVEKMGEELQEWIDEVESVEGSHLKMPIKSLRDSIQILRKARTDFYMNVERAG